MNTINHKGDKLSRLEKIKFQGQEFLFCDGAITNKEAYENGGVSFAHLCDNNEVMQFGKKIGVKSDIEFTGEFEDVKPTATAMLNLLEGFSF